MGIWTYQSNMNRGELDPTLLGRIDIQPYFNGLQKAFNVLSLPQGGITRRSGTDFLGFALGDGRFESFSFNLEQSYLLVFTSLKMQVYKDGILQLNLNGSGNNFISTPWDLPTLADVDFIQSADTAIITHPNYSVTTISRTSDTNWSLLSAVISNIPKFDFGDTASPIPISEVQQITFTDAVEGDTYRISLNNILTDSIAFSGDDSSNVESIKDAIGGLPSISGGITVTTILSLVTYEITFAGNSADKWELATITPVLTNKTTFKGETTRVTAGSSSKEDVWSILRGWPRTCTFHEARLYFGGSKSRPQTLWGSNVNDFFNFDSGRARDDELINITLDTNQVNGIQAIYSNRALQIFTSGAEFFIGKSPITPSNISAVPQSRLGSKRIQPVSIDGVTLFAQRTGKAINQFLFVDEFKSSQASPVSSLAQHLINNPVKMAVSTGTDSTNASYVYILNKNGELTVFNTLISEDVQAFTVWKTNGLIKSIAVVFDKLYMLVERVINSTTSYHIEVESLTALSDASITKDILGLSVITGLSHLEGETVDVKADGSYMGELIVSGGQVTIDRAANIVEVGLKYTPIIQTMPLSIDTGGGANAAKQKRILRAAIRMHESNGILVNGQRLSDKTIGLNQFDAPSPKTQLKRITLGGWSIDATITITQETPMPMTILSIGMEVKV